MLAHVEANDTGRKTERLAARLSPERKAMLERAAKLQGVDLTEFAMAAATAAARETIDRHEVTRLTPADHVAFAKALDAEPTDALVEAFRLRNRLEAR
jgi:uncharacterized protein (DUF1778 family)